MRKLITGLLPAFVLAVGTWTAAMAAEGHIEHKESHWPHAGLFGSFDRAALQRGFQVYQNVCQACHSLKYLSFRNLEALGYSEDEVKAIAAQYQVQDGPNDSGEMFERSARHGRADGARRDPVPGLDRRAEARRAQADGPQGDTVPDRDHRPVRGLQAADLGGPALRGAQRISPQR
jgi:cytochrome c1